MAGRADRIIQILVSNGGRLQVQDIRMELARLEKVAPADLNPSIVSATVFQDNRVRATGGQAKRFRTYGEGDESHGFISLVDSQVAPQLISQTLKNPADEIPELIEQANSRVRDQLKEEVVKLSWQEFESNLLRLVLEALGFQDVEITQPTRDGGQDALCTYKRGLVASQVIVSAKHWKTQAVGPSEVQRLRGIQGVADTAVIVTSSKFTKGAIEEAKPSQNQRAVVLIDIALIVDACFRETVRNQIGVQEVRVPQLFRIGKLFPSEAEGDPED